MSEPLLGATFCCLLPMIYGVSMFALGYWYKKHNGLPWQIVRRDTDDDDLE